MAEARIRPTLRVVPPSQPRPALPPRSDVVLASVFLGLSLLQVVIAPIASPAVSALVAVGATVPLAWRRVYPAGAALAGTAVWLIPTPEGFLLLGYVIAGLLFFSLGAHDPAPWRVLVVSGVAVVVGVVMTLLGPEPAPAAIGSALVVVGPVAAGRLVAHQRAQTALLRDLTARLVQERATAERAAVAEERSRIARELHDVIGHEVTVIALQADAAAAALAKAPERAAAPVAAIRRSAAEALAEMRRVVGMLRAAEEEDLRPQPGLTDLPALVEQSRAAGTSVDLTVRAPDRPTPPSVELAAYRLVQEALTNARRHSPGSPVDVRVVGEDDRVVVEVVNTGEGSAPASAGSGFGLVGMRERVRLLGGRLDAGPTAEGGYSLTATLPLESRGPA
jgi:signal transduction histidine kinase